MDGRSAHQTDTFMLWVDAVGGFWVCSSDRITLGQPLRCGAVDVPILADISGQHARIRRDGEGYLIEAVRDVRLDGRPVQGAALLADGSHIELGQAVRLVFHRPHALSATARLDFLSHHRTQPSADAVLLMAESCILGPSPHSHVVCRDWPQQVILYRHEDQLHCRVQGGVEIDGVYYADRGPPRRDSHIAGEGFSLSLEPINV
jgi:hypothetical protein